MLLQIHKRLQQLKGIGGDETFGDVSIAQVGDAYARFHKSGSLWKDEFKIFELDEIMRQR